MFYYCATVTAWVHLIHHLISTSANSTWIQTLNLSLMRWVFYHCATTTGQAHNELLVSNPWLWDDEMSVLPLYYYNWPITQWTVWLKPSTRDGRWVFYHCAIAISQQHSHMFTIFSLLVPATAGGKPWNLGSLVDCSTNFPTATGQVQNELLPFSLSLCHFKVWLKPSTLW